MRGDIVGRICRPYGAGDLFRTAFYKDAAPAALRTCDSHALRNFLTRRSRRFPQHFQTGSETNSVVPEGTCENSPALKRRAIFSASLRDGDCGASALALNALGFLYGSPLLSAGESFVWTRLPGRGATV